MSATLVALLWSTVGAAPAPCQGTAPATGRLEGIATISTRLTTPRTRVRVYGEPGTPPATLQADDNPLANVVLYLESTPSLRAGASWRPSAVLRQHDERFMPHVLPVLVGTTVAFPNDDPLYHNVFSLSRARTFDLGRYPKGSSKSLSFPTAGVVQLFCHIHADMSGYILVLDNPFFTIPDVQGHFVIDSIPPGEYRLVTWHERIRPMVTPVRIESGRTTTLTLRIPLPELIETPPPARP